MPALRPRPSLTFREVTDGNRAEVIGVKVAPGQDRFVNSVEDAMEEAVEWARAKPWYRAVYAGDEPVGFVMLSWNVESQPPDIIGPWFLWKLIVDARHQAKGYGREIVRMVVDLVRREGATELLTSHVPGDGSPAGFYARLGFIPTGALDPNGEIILRLDLSNP
jgi:diamine N-acetyltransferase